MKEVLMYKADDETVFKHQWDALEHDILLKILESLKKLVRMDEQWNSDFAKGIGFKQLSDMQAAVFRSELEKYKKERKPEWFIRKLEFISDCIDLKNRLWGQPYFASHPDEGKQIAL